MAVHRPRHITQGLEGQNTSFNLSALETIWELNNGMTSDTWLLKITRAAEWRGSWEMSRCA